MDGHNRKRIRTSTHNVDAPRKHIALDFRDETTLENTKKRRRIEQDGRAQSQSQSPFPKSPMRERSTNLISPSLHSPIDAPAISPHNLQIGLDLPHSTPDSRSDTPQSSAGPVAPSTIHFVPSLNTSTPAVNSPSQAAAVPQVSPHLARNRNSLHASTMTRVVRAQPTHAFSTPLSNNSVDAAIERSSSDEEDNAYDPALMCPVQDCGHLASKMFNLRQHVQTHLLTGRPFKPPSSGGTGWYQCSVGGCTYMNRERRHFNDHLRSHTLKK